MVLRYTTSGGELQILKTTVITAIQIDTERNINSPVKLENPKEVVFTPAKSPF